MNWISVEERLPDTSDIMLIRYLQGSYCVGYGYYDGLFLDDNGCSVHNVTHWCEITEPARINRIVKKTTEN